MTRRQTALVWAAVVVPIAAWIAHLSAEASLVRLACDHDRVTWIMHAITVGLGLICVGCIAIGLTYARRTATVGANGSFKFLGAFAAAIAAVNLLLIVWEGLYVPFLPLCR